MTLSVTFKVICLLQAFSDLIFSLAYTAHYRFCGYMLRKYTVVIDISVHDWSDSVAAFA